MTDTPQEPTPRTEGPTPRADKARAGMSFELSEITTAIGTLIEHMDQSLPEDRVKDLVEATLAEERRSRFRLVVSLLAPIFVVLILGIVQINHGSDIKDSAKDSRVVADYVRDCLIDTTPDPKKCGSGDGATLFFGYLNCAFEILRSGPPEATFADCARKATGG